MNSVCQFEKLGIPQHQLRNSTDTRCTSTAYVDNSAQVVTSGARQEKISGLAGRQEVSFIRCIRKRATRILGQIADRSTKCSRWLRTINDAEHASNDQSLRLTGEHPVKHFFGEEFLQRVVAPR
jgi:hypothetical protein